MFRQVLIIRSFSISFLSRIDNRRWPRIRLIFHANFTFTSLINAAYRGRPSPRITLLDKDLSVPITFLGRFRSIEGRNLRRDKSRFFHRENDDETRYNLSSFLATTFFHLAQDTRQDKSWPWLPTFGSDTRNNNKVCQVRHAAIFRDK